MIKKMTSVLLALSLVALPLAAEKDKKETERLENCGTVLKEILDIPDDIPTDLLNQAECVIVIPTVIKLAFGISGNACRCKRASSMTSFAANGT